MTINQILTVAANWAPWWSFSSLWDSLRALQWAAAISAAILTLGAVVEYWAKLKLLTLLIGKWLFRRSTPFDRCAFNKIVAHSLGPILVTVGIAGDFIFEGRAFILEDRQEEQARQTIGSLGETARKADEKARTAISDSSIALTQAKDALDKAGQAQESIRETEGKASKAQQEADSVATRTDELNRQLTAAKTRLQAVDDKRAELEQSLLNLAICNTPRVLPYTAVLDIGGMRASTDPLRPFARQAIIEFVRNDAEARRAARNIAGSLRRAKWTVGDPTPGGDDISDGVNVEAPMSPREATNSQWQMYLNSHDAADAVVDFLHSYNWEAKTGPALDEHGHLVRDLTIIPLDSLRIRVGLYPAVPFVNPRGASAKEVADSIANTNAQTKEHEKERDKANLDELEELSKNLTAQEAASLRAAYEASRKRDEEHNKRYIQPCQPLSTLTLTP